MQITEIPFKGIQPGEDAKILSLKDKPGNGWSGLQVLPVGLTLFGCRQAAYSLSNYGAIRFGDKYFIADKVLPLGLDEFESDNIVVPWGEQQKLNSCGTAVDVFVQDGSLVFNCKTTNKFNTREVYQYQVRFPLARPNIVQVHYYHCVSGYDTFVGAVNQAGDDFISWPALKQNQPYMKKALEIDTSPTAVAPSQDFPPATEPTEEPVNPPSVNQDSISRIIISGENLKYEVMK